jgi:hypothetical protein
MRRTVRKLRKWIKVKMGGKRWIKKCKVGVRNVKKER